MPGRALGRRPTRAKTGKSSCASPPAPPPRPPRTLALGPSGPLASYLPHSSKSLIGDSAAPHLTGDSSPLSSSAVT